MWFTLLASHWRLVALAALLSIIGGQQLWIHHLAAEITEIREAQIEAVNRQLIDNSAKEANWHKAITAGFQNYQASNDKTRSTYEHQIISLAAAGRVRPSANESSPVPATAGTADLQACEDRLAAARAAATGCVDAARAANDCEAKLELMWNGWPK